MEQIVYSPALPLTLDPYKTLYMTSFMDKSLSAQSLSNFYVDLIRSTGHDVKLDSKYAQICKLTLIVLQFILFSSI